jgi:NADH-quinone oxidoreductase subunit L
MAHDKDIRRYFTLLGFFTFAMLGTIMAGNLLVIFVFWELVGFSSYLLIGYWLNKPEAGAAAKKAFIFNRIGDAGFLIGLMIIWANAGSFDLNDILIQSEIQAWQTAASLCLFCGVIGKSAQFPLITWLPDAMEGPTPASALIHAATMVAAGVYLLAKLFLLFTPTALTIAVCVGALTALMASLSALTQTDIKKILAYSTVSQLGFMVIAVGVGAQDAAMMHLFTHAFFKAGLFLGAGAVIHALHQLEHQSHRHFDVQDLHNLGGLRKHLPVTFITFLLCGAALAGLPFFSGFLSKDAILTAVWLWKGSEFSWKWGIVAVAFTIPFLTVLYTFRLIWFIFFGENRTEKVIGKPAIINEVPAVMRLPLVLLSVASGWFLISVNPFDFSGWLYATLHIGEEIHRPSITLFSGTWVLLALAVAFYYFKNKSIVRTESMLGNLTLNAFYLDTLYKHLIAKPVQQGSLLMERIDRKWIEGFIHYTVYIQVTFAHVIAWVDRFIVDGIVQGISRAADALGKLTRSFQSGKIQLYVFWSVLGIVIFLLSMLF